MTAGSISNSLRAIDGTPYCFDSSAVISSSLIKFQLDEIGAELAPVLALVVQRLLQLLRGDALFFEKQFADTNGHF